MNFSQQAQAERRRKRIIEILKDRNSRSKNRRTTPYATSVYIAKSVNNKQDEKVGENIIRQDLNILQKRGEIDLFYCLHYLENKSAILVIAKYKERRKNA